MNLLKVFSGGCLLIILIVMIFESVSFYFGALTT